jgi:hypothetical protein
VFDRGGRVRFLRRFGRASWSGHRLDGRSRDCFHGRLFCGCLGSCFCLFYNWRNEIRFELAISLAFCGGRLTGQALSHSVGGIFIE